ncbi:hypothetical protein JCM5350_002581 [Sporobolomyces pararoseus]
MLNSISRLSTNLLDDFELPYLIRRADLLKPQDVQAFSVDSSYLEEAFKYPSTDRNQDQPPAVIGCPPYCAPSRLTRCTLWTVR